MTSTDVRTWAGSCRCGAFWGGYSEAHCSGCHRTFSTVGNFDRHRRYGECVDPAAVGLTPTTRSHGEVWQMPGRDETAT